MANLELAIIIILMFFLIATIGLLFLQRLSFFRGLASSTPLMLTSLGITFTFVGVLSGLMDFDLRNIDEGITALLEGLKVAFVSSVLGISMATIFRIIQLFLQSDTGDTDDIAEIMRRGFDNLAQLLGGDGEHSLGKQMAILHKSLDSNFYELSEALKSFTQETVDKSTEALSQALRGIISDFNSGLSMQMGKSLSTFSHAVGEMVDWQKQNRLEMDGMVESLQKIRGSLEVSADKIGEIAKETGQLPRHVEAMAKAQEMFKEEMAQVHDGLSHLTDISARAKKDFPLLAKGLGDVTEQLTATNQSFGTTVDSIQEVIKLSASNLKQNSDSAIGLMTDMHKQTHKAMEDTAGSVQQMSSELQKTLTTTQEGLRSIIEESLSGINIAIRQLDSSMQEEIQRCVTVMGNNVTRITEEFVEQYGRLAEVTAKGKQPKS